MCILASLSQHQHNFPKVNSKSLTPTVPKFNFVNIQYLIFFFYHSPIYLINGFGYK